MTVHFITASRGGDEPHVTSGDDARQNVAHIGNVNYVGKTGDQLSASMTSSNTLRILSGDGWICGRHWSVDGFEDVTIENGNPGYNRKDLVVFHAETSPSDNGYITVIKGEETTGDAVVPTYAEGDLNEGDTVAEMPLYVVSLTGVSVGDPEPQFDVLMPYNEFRTSIAQHSTTETQTDKTWIDGKPIYRKILRMGPTNQGGSTSIAHAIDYDIITHCEAIAYYDVGTCIPIPRIGFEGNTRDTGYDTNYFIDSANIIVQSGNKVHYDTVFFIVEYTKA